MYNKTNEKLLLDEIEEEAMLAEEVLFGEESESEPQEIPVGFTTGQFLGVLGFGMFCGSMFTLAIIAAL